MGKILFDLRDGWIQTYLSCRYWNPYTECDVDFAGQTQQPVEFVDVGCNPALCGPTDPYYQNMPFESTCLAIDGHTVAQPGVPQIDV